MPAVNRVTKGSSDADSDFREIESKGVLAAGIAFDGYPAASTPGEYFTTHTSPVLVQSVYVSSPARIGRLLYGYSICQ